MINRYRRAARSVTELGLGSLAPLDQGVPELAELQAAGDSIASNPEEEDEVESENVSDSGYFGPVAQSVELRTFNP
jgi:hypothetical protein